MLGAVSIDLKGSNFTLLVISVYTNCMQTVRLLLEEKIRQAPNFFSKKTPIVINASTINNSSDWFNLYKTISDIGLFVVGACCCYDKTLKKIIIQSGLPILTKGNKDIIFNYKEVFCNKHNWENKNCISCNFKTQIIDKPIRSGQKIYARNRDLVVIANVSTGAEIIADGNIHIYGAMRGRVLAGASGNEKSQIFCNNLFPELISINGYYWLIDQIPQEFLGKSARFYLHNKNLIIQHIL